MLFNYSEAFITLPVIFREKVKLINNSLLMIYSSVGSIFIQRYSAIFNISVIYQIKLESDT